MRCLVLGNVFTVIVGSGSCCNCFSTRLVHTLSLSTQPHPFPYRLDWINPHNGIIVNTRVLVPIQIGNYIDQILCDVIPMDIGHIIFGRPWPFDNNTLHDGFSNKITFSQITNIFCFLFLLLRYMQMPVPLKRKFNKNICLSR